MQRKNKNSICTPPKMFSFGKVSGFLWVLHVLQLWTMRSSGDDGLWLLFYENLKRNRVEQQRLFVRCFVLVLQMVSRICWKKDQWMEVDDLWEAMKMWLLLRNLKLNVLQIHYLCLFGTIQSVFVYWLDSFFKLM